MKNLSWMMLFVLSLSLTVGCGGTTAPAPVAEQDELAKYAAENPSPPETPVD